eukprot:6202050-Amphidinium_carterae.1
MKGFISTRQSAALSTVVDCNSRMLTRARISRAKKKRSCTVLFATVWAFIMAPPCSLVHKDRFLRP